MCWKRAVISSVDYVIRSLVVFREWMEPVPVINREISKDTQEELSAAANELLQNISSKTPAPEPAAKVELKSAELLPSKNIKICLEITAGSNGFSIFIPPNQQEGFDNPARPPPPQEEARADFGEEDVKIKLDMGSFALPEEDLRTKPTLPDTEEDDDVNVDEFQTPNENGNQSGSEDDV